MLARPARLQQVAAAGLIYGKFAESRTTKNTPHLGFLREHVSAHLSPHPSMHGVDGLSALVMAYDDPAAGLENAEHLPRGPLFLRYVWKAIMANHFVEGALEERGAIRRSCTFFLLESG
jgi:hypothetical protein